MAFLDDMKSLFGSYNAPTGASQTPQSNSSDFFNRLLSGAATGASQAVATSDWGKQLQAFLGQAQSGAAAQTLFSNPLMLLLAIGAIVFLLVKVVR